jgi:glutathione S-transferase
MGAIEDLLHKIVHTLGLEGDELKEARERLADGWVTVILKGLDDLLERGGEYFADNRLTVADLKVVGITQWLMSGQLDHIPTDIVERLAPRLVAHAKRVSEDPIVTAYYAARSQ